MQRWASLKPCCQLLAGRELAACCLTSCPCAPFSGFQRHDSLRVAGHEWWHDCRLPDGAQPGVLGVQFAPPRIPAPMPLADMLLCPPSRSSHLQQRVCSTPLLQNKLLLRLFDLGTGRCLRASSCDLPVEDQPVRKRISLSPRLPPGGLYRKFRCRHAVFKPGHGNGKWLAHNPLYLQLVCRQASPRAAAPCLHWPSLWPIPHTMMQA